MKKYYITAGFMGSGSSAMTDLLCEFEGVSAPNGNYEYVFLHAPNGVFDLEDKLLIGNNALRSDEALHSFLDYMGDLYRKKRYWVAGYKEKVSDDFMDYVDRFIHALAPIRLDGTGTYWHYMENPTKSMFFMRFLRKMICLATFKKVWTPPPLRYHGMLLAYPTRAEFYSAARKFVYTVMDAIRSDNRAVVLDQFLLPHNLFRVDNYFDDDACVILVDRDPRDVFISNKYFWAPKHVQVPFPMDVDEFCTVYKKMRENITEYKSKKIYRFRFEDLIYSYEGTLQKIYGQLELTKHMHVNKGKFFDPNKSIANTNLQRLDSAYEREAATIEANLPGYIYDFPETQPGLRSRNEIF